MLNIIVAPLSVSPKAEKIAKSIVRFIKEEKIEYAVYFSMAIEDLISNVKTLAGETDFVIVGDDVSVHAFINNVKDLGRVKLGIVPTGKNDDFANYLELNSNPIQAIKDILENNVEQVDYLLVNEEKVINSVIIGATVETAQAFEQYKLKNFITQKFASMNYGDKFEGIELQIEQKNGKPKKEIVFELVVANGGFSKGKPVSPLSNVKDGLFNLIYSTSDTKKSKKKFTSQFKKGNHIYDESTKQLWLGNIKISNSDRKIKAMIDGKIENVEELNISVVENGLKLFKRKN